MVTLTVTDLYNLTKDSIDLTTGIAHLCRGAGMAFSMKVLGKFDVQNDPSSKP